MQFPFTHLDKKEGSREESLKGEGERGDRAHTLKGERRRLKDTLTFKKRAQHEAAQKITPLQLFSPNLLGYEVADLKEQNSELFSKFEE